jgi:hypothetical protein
LDSVARGETAEAHIDALIERRDIERRQTKGERAREQLWAQSVRAYDARQGEEQRLERVAKLREGGLTRP